MAYITTPLPPKRFQSPANAVYDPIRHHPWFQRVVRRRKKIPLLKQAYELMLTTGATQVAAAARFSVDERELRDYQEFISGVGRPIDPAFQSILDVCYHEYAKSGCKVGIRGMIDKYAPFYGKNPRHVIEEWETNPNYYPTGYPKHPND